MSKPWKLIIGIHRGTLMSRNASESYHDTLEECREVFKKREKHYTENLGGQIWFAVAKGPGAETVQLTRGSSLLGPLIADYILSHLSIDDAEGKLLDFLGESNDD